MIDKKLEIFGLREDEIKTFVYLIENGAQTVGTIAKNTGIYRPSLYVYLKNLSEKGLITQSQKNGVKIFIPSGEERINIQLDLKIKELEETKNILKKTFLDIQKGKKPASSPRLQLFEGEKEVKLSMNDPFLYRNIETKSYWPMKSMLETFGADFSKKHNEERVKRNISIQAIWPEKQKVDTKKYPYLGVNEEFLREVRVAPKEIDFSMGYWVYENKVAFISSRKSNFGFIIENDEFADMVRSQFKVMWQLSKPLRVKEDTSKKLFKRMMSE